jgi:ABC-2 type transport system permease protein
MSTAALAWQQFRVERKIFWRTPTAAFFSFVLPLMLLLLVASVFASDPDELEIVIPGIAGMSVMATTFNALAFNITFRREQGILKRVRGTPLPAVSYFAGSLASYVANAFVQVGLVVVLGHLLYDVSWPHDWLALVVFTAVGVVTFGALGIAFSNVIPNYDAAPALVNAVFLPAIFISGVFYSSDTMPRVLEIVADVLPLKHVIDGLHAAIVTGDGLGATVDSLAILIGWFAIGAWAVTRRFRWEA